MSRATGRRWRRRSCQGGRPCAATVSRPRTARRCTAWCAADRRCVLAGGVCAEEGTEGASAGGGTPAAVPGPPAASCCPPRRSPRRRCYTARQLRASRRAAVGRTRAWATQAGADRRNDDSTGCRAAPDGDCSIADDRQLAIGAHGMQSAPKQTHEPFPCKRCVVLAPTASLLPLYAVHSLH